MVLVFASNPVFAGIEGFFAFLSEKMNCPDYPAN
jgi:hypothetical protein